MVIKVLSGLKTWMDFFYLNNMGINVHQIKAPDNIICVFSINQSFLYFNYKVTKSQRAALLKKTRIPICLNHLKKLSWLHISPEIHPKKLTRKITQKPSPPKEFELSKKNLLGHFSNVLFWRNCLLKQNNWEVFYQ